MLLVNWTLDLASDWLASSSPIIIWITQNIHIKFQIFLLNDILIIFATMGDTYQLSLTPIRPGMEMGMGIGIINI